jgi:hypothetical protein
MNEVPESVLQECLDLLAQGKPIEQIMGRYPEQEAALRPFLETAAQLTTLAPQPSLAAKQKSQKAFLAHAKNLKVTPVRPSAWYRLRQILLPLASLALVLILFATTTVSISASAIPGDALYSVKRLVEDVRLNQARNPETAVALMGQFREERVREVQTLLRTRRSAEVTFVGEIETFQADQWTVAGITVDIEENTTIVGTPQQGELARVNGRTENGRLIATTIEVLTGSPPNPQTDPTPQPMPSPTLQPTTEPTDEPTVTATVEPTNKPTATTTAEPTITATVEPTDEPTTIPTATAPPPPTATSSPVPTTPPSNDNDDENDNNDNDGSNDNDDNDNDDDDNDNDDNDNDDDGNDNDDNDNDDNDNDNDDNSGSGNNNNDNDDDDDD